MRNKTVAIVGATGAVGREFIGCIESRGLELEVAEAAGVGALGGQDVPFRGEDLIVEELTENSFDGVDIALFSAGSGISKQYAPIAVKAGAVVVDNCSAFRMDPARAAGGAGDQCPPDQGSQRHHRQSQLLGDHHPGAALADASGQSASSG